MTPWWQPILGWGGVIIAAIIAGGIALRTAQGTPYETLKTLVEILDKSHLLGREDRQVLEIAIHREVQRIEQLNQARLEGFWAYQRVRLKQLDSTGPLAGVLAAILVPTIGMTVAYAIENFVLR
ncbi:hypothetical protein IU459_05795 [Nocardia amamiensis]|uniref:MotA/TolQ/ExbB proton channel domain-containing protein n=1 Tax=Nocardia amamiensis TaxID=404578 RepID=A0ABS0CKB5_9NOCA|nr:hypothetical protein [Nocardia amamiensis]MBF6297055.1 hypothetical protein [Nocardia amamiensis]